MTLWAKDGGGLDDKVARFTVGRDVEWDNVLLPYDIQATRAHAWGLQAAGILSASEFAQIDRELDALRRDVEDGTVCVRTEDEDCHTVIESFLTSRLGDTGKRVHTGRSRNDQVVAALRLFLSHRMRSIGQNAIRLVESLAEKAGEYDGVLLPGYTHYQRAMPSTVPLWCMGYAEVLVGDLSTLKHAFSLVNVSPLGSAAGFGIPHLELDREAVAERAGFGSIQVHATAVQLNRGKIELAALHALLQLSSTINRLASDIVLYMSAEFGFANVADAFTTGSSIMPQKRNPDVFELLRARYHRVAAEVSLLVSLPANLPSGYHRDLQLTKEAAMRGTIECEETVSMAVDILPSIRFNRTHTTDAIEPDMLSTAFVLDQARQGVPFRDAYGAWSSRQQPVVDPEEILSAYRMTGHPGQEDPMPIVAAARAHRSWTSSH